MNKDTEILIESSNTGNLNPKFDAVCKELFMNREIIAPVLKGAVPEYMNCSIDKIISCIDEESIVSDPVDDVSATQELKENNSKIKGLPTEMSSMTDKLIRYDTRFRAKNPRLSNQTIQFYLHIDLEVQNNYTPGYPLIKRAIYYVAREICSQLGILTGETDYNRLQKAYSIWICNENIPEEIQNTVTSYSFKKSDIIGTTDEPDADYDLMSVIMIRRGNDYGEADIFNYLSGVFNGNKDRITQYVDIEHNEKIEEVFHSMSGLGDSIERKAFEKGHAEGHAEGLAEGREEGMQQGIMKGILESAIAMLKNGIDPEMVAKCSGLPLPKILELAKS